VDAVEDVVVGVTRLVGLVVVVGEGG